METEYGRSNKKIDRQTSWLGNRSGQSFCLNDEERPLRRTYKDLSETNERNRSRRPTQILLLASGEKGIRTPGAFQLSGFQDRRNRPLCHLSGSILGGHDPFSSLESRLTVEKVHMTRNPIFLLIDTAWKPASSKPMTNGSTNKI